MLLIAPGGLHSAAERWAHTPFDPRERLTEYRLLAMDQRNAGQSTGPVEPDHGWATYTEDQLAVLDHLDIERCVVLGMCIGGPYLLRLALTAPNRVAGLLMFQPIGLTDNRAMFLELFDSWRASIQADHPEATPQRWAAYRENMFGGDFLFGATRDDARACPTPAIVFEGTDAYHPSEISRELTSLMPNASLVARWKDRPDEVRSRIVAFVQGLFTT